MVIYGKTIAEHLLRILREQVLEKSQRKSRPPHVVIISVEPTAQEDSYLRIKTEAAHRIGATIDIKQFLVAPSQEALLVLIQSLNRNEDVDGIILQQPLPSTLNIGELLAAISPKKDIESQCESSPYDPPLGLAVATACWYGIQQEDGANPHPLVTFLHSFDDFIQEIQGKQITLVGRGATGGRPIAKLFAKFKVPFTQIDANTPNPTAFIQNSDIIISAVGKKTIHPESLKTRVGLISAGYRKVGDKWVGDYDIEEIESIASFYTPTPRGIGPLDVAFVMKNLVESWG